jgi:hypothetical protein
MRILYGVVGEGMGHAMRSRVVLDELTRAHQVQVVVSGRAHDYLKARQSDRLGVTRIWGLTMVYEDNEVRKVRTVLQNVKGAFAGGLPKNVKAYFDLATHFDPEVVVSDFETWSYLFAKSRGLPVISIDNQQIINRCTHAPEILAGHEADLRLTKAVVKAKLPGCSARASRRVPSWAITCSSTRPPPPTRTCWGCCAARASSAASTGCGAASRRSRWRGTYASVRSPRLGSWRTCARRAGCFPAAASRSWARRSTSTSPCCRSR